MAYKARTEDNKCIFCEIAKGNIDASVFWQDKEFMAFLAIDPNTEGFSCVIPKKHYDSDVLKLPENVFCKLMIASKKAASILENYFKDVGRVGVIIEGMGINHAHVKLIPMHGTDYLQKGEWKQILSGKNFWFDKYEGWLSSGSGPMADPKELKQLASALKDINKKN